MRLRTAMLFAALGITAATNGMAGYVYGRFTYGTGYIGKYDDSSLSEVWWTSAPYIQQGATTYFLTDLAIYEGYIYGRFALPSGHKIGKYNNSLSEVWLRDAPSFTVGYTTYYLNDISVSEGYIYGRYTYSDGEIAKYRESDMTEIWRRPLPTYQSGYTTYYLIDVSVSGGYIYGRFTYGTGMIAKYRESDMSLVWIRTAPTYQSGYTTYSLIDLSVSGGCVYGRYTTTYGKIGKYRESDLGEVWIKDSPTYQVGATTYFLVDLATWENSPPTGSILINSGTAYTTSSSVTLTLSATDDSGSVSSMRFSNDGASWSSWEGYNDTKSWTLSSGDGLKTVYVQFKDSAGNASGSYSDTIMLDSTPPSGSVNINGGAARATNASVVLTLSASDSGSGVSQMRFSNDGANWSSWEDYGTGKSWTLNGGDGLKTVCAQFNDLAGNLSATAAATIMLEMDSDGDGIPDWWETEYFGGATNAVAWEDSDSDGLNNYQEWIAGTSPTNAADYFHVNSWRFLGNENGFVTGWDSKTGRVYRVWSTTNLFSPWAIRFQMNGTGVGATYTNQDNSTSLFLWVSVEKQ